MAPKPLVRPGPTTWAGLAPKAEIEPANKIEALKQIATALPADTPYRAWFLHKVTLWAVSTGSSFESVLGLKRSGVPSPHRVAFLAARDDHIRYIARAMPESPTTEKAQRIAAIIRAEEKAPSVQADRLVRELHERFPNDVPTSDRQVLRVLHGEASD